MHDQLITTLSGPDFLEAVADAEAANDNHINADVYRTRAKQWQRDEHEIARLQTALEVSIRALAQVNRIATAATHG